MRRALAFALSAFCCGGCIRAQESVVSGTPRTTTVSRVGPKLELIQARADGPGRTRLVAGWAQLCADTERIETPQTARTEAEPTTGTWGVGAAFLGLGLYGLASRNDGVMWGGVAYGAVVLVGASVRVQSASGDRPLPPRVEERPLGTRPCGFVPAPGRRVTWSMGGVVDERIAGPDGVVLVDRAPSADLTVLLGGTPVPVWWEPP